MANLGFKTIVCDTGRLQDRSPSFDEVEESLLMTMCHDILWGFHSETAPAEANCHNRPTNLPQPRKEIGGVYHIIIGRPYPHIGGVLVSEQRRGHLGNSTPVLGSIDMEPLLRLKPLGDYVGLAGSNANIGYIDFDSLHGKCLISQRIEHGTNSVNPGGDGRQRRNDPHSYPPKQQ